MNPKRKRPRDFKKCTQMLPLVPAIDRLGAIASLEAISFGSNKKLLGTSASLLVTSVLLVVTRTLVETINKTRCDLIHVHRANQQIF